MTDVEIDQEVKIKRRPQAKIDSTLLLSPRGLELLRRNALKSLRLKGRGHEQHDLTQIVEVYRLWAHGIYSKASFEDCLALIRKAGCDSVLGAARREWIAHEKQLRRGVQALGPVNFTTAANVISELSETWQGSSTSVTLSPPQAEPDVPDFPDTDDLQQQTMHDQQLEDQELYIDQDELDAARELGF